MQMNKASTLQLLRESRKQKGTSSTPSTTARSMSYSSAHPSHSVIRSIHILMIILSRDSLSLLLPMYIQSQKI